MIIYRRGSMVHKFLTWMIWVPPWEGHPSILVNLCKSWRWRWCWHWRWPQDCRCVICSRSSAAASFNAKPDVLLQLSMRLSRGEFLDLLVAHWNPEGAAAVTAPVVQQVMNHSPPWLQSHGEETGAFCDRCLWEWSMSVIVLFQVEVLMLSNLLGVANPNCTPAASGFIALSIVPHQRRSSAGVIQARGSVFKGGKESISHNLCVVLRVPCGC